MKRLSQDGYTLVEIAVALGVVAFGLLTVVALFPLGVQSNKISAEESRATMILSLVETDLRNTYPNATPANSKSILYGLMLPYVVDAAGKRSFNPNLPATPPTALDATISTGLDDYESLVATNASPRPRYQVSVVYLNKPTAGDLLDLRARVIVSWPALPNGSVNDLTNSTKVQGFVETLVSFPAP